jgi:hypothetical protein
MSAVLLASVVSNSSWRVSSRSFSSKWSLLA